MSKRRKGYPSETHVKRRRRVVRGKKELIELLRQRSRPYLFSNSLPPVIAAAALKLDDADLAAIDRAFPPPTRARPLAMR